MANLNAVNVPVATTHKTKLDLSHDRVTSMGFMRLLPVFYRHMIKGESLDVKCDSTVRLAPVEVPFFGSLVQNIRYFAVKYSQIFPNWYNFINDNIGSNYSTNSLVSNVPSVSAGTLVGLFTTGYYEYTYFYANNESFGDFAPTHSVRFKYFDTRSIEINGVTVTFSAGYYSVHHDLSDVPDLGEYYVAYNDADDDVIIPVDVDLSAMTYSVGGNIYSFDYIENGIGYNYEMYGRRFLNVLRSLGYEVTYGASKDFMYNCLAILALARVYLDWYSNSQYLNSAQILLIERLLKYNDPSNYLELDLTDLCNILHLTNTVIYDTDDYYVNAWDNPMSANNGQYTDFRMFDPTSTGGAYIHTTAHGTSEMVSSRDYPLSIGTQYIHSALQRLTDYQKRHQLSARSIDRALAQYGAVPSNLSKERSIYLGHQVNVIKSGAVMATADGSSSDSQSTVGDYAGAGFGQSSDVISYQTDDECIVIGVASIIPQGSMVQGYDRVNRRLDKLSFFQPELDFGVTAIEKGEVYVSPVDTFVDSSDDGVNSYTGVFGFSGSYPELKRPKNFLTGDLSLPRIMAGGNSWHLFRLFSDDSFNGTSADIVHSLSFTRGFDSLQYNRIFQYTDHDFDPFFCFMHFDVAAFAPCRPLFDTYDFDDDTDGNKTVNISNGNKVN